MRSIALLAGLLLATPAAAQQRIDRPGPVVVEQVRATFPEQVGEFRRANVVSFGSNGDNISASYNLVRNGQRLLITVFVYPVSRMVAGPRADTDAAGRAARCQAEFDATNGAVTRAHGDAQLVETGPVAAPPGVGQGLSHRSMFRLRGNFDNRVQDLRSEARLYCYVGGDLQVKYRASWPEDMDVAADIARFIAQGPWPGRTATEPGTVAP